MEMCEWCGAIGEHYPECIYIGAKDFRPSDEADFYFDLVQNPEHYVIKGPDGKKLCEVRDVQYHATRYLVGMNASDMSNHLKYSLRSPYKDDMLKDLKKSRFHLDALIARLEDVDKG